MQTKKCSICKEEKSVSEFTAKGIYKRKYPGKIRYTSYCKTCLSLRRRKNYKEGNYKIVIAEYKKRSHKKLFDEIRLIKEKSGCIVCGERDPRCLIFHHRDPSTKIDNICTLINKCKRKLVYIEIEKCDILCSNCHMKIHFK